MNRYFWNTETNETSWTDPNSKLASVDLAALARKQKSKPKKVSSEIPDLTKEKAKAENSVMKPPPERKEGQSDDDYYNSQEYYDWYMENYQQGSAGQVGEYKPVEEKPEEHPVFEHMANLADLHVIPSGNNIDYSKAMRHMSYYFDVEKYQRERAAEILKGIMLIFIITRWEGEEEIYKEAAGSF